MKQSPASASLDLHTRDRSRPVRFIDEFYKLGAQSDPDRGHLLNQPFYKLWKTEARFYFLGPNIHAIPADRPGSFDSRFIRTDFSTVAAYVHRVPPGEDERQALTDLCRELDDPRSSTVVRRSGRGTSHGGYSRQASAQKCRSFTMPWSGLENFHPEWLVGKALASGIGVHHGRLARSLAHFMVKAFNDRKIRFLSCTATLIEGVNTKAKNVVIFDNRVAMTPVAATRAR